MNASRTASPATMVSAETVRAMALAYNADELSAEVAEMIATGTPVIDVIAIPDRRSGWTVRLVATLTIVVEGVGTIAADMPVVASWRRRDGRETAASMADRFASRTYTGLPVQNRTV